MINYIIDKGTKNNKIVFSKKKKTIKLNGVRCTIDEYKKIQRHLTSNNKTSKMTLATKLECN